MKINNRDIGSAKRNGSGVSWQHRSMAHQNLSGGIMRGDEK